MRYVLAVLSLWMAGWSLLLPPAFGALGWLTAACLWMVCAHKGSLMNTVRADRLATEGGSDE